MTNIVYQIDKGNDVISIDILFKSCRSKTRLIYFIRYRCILCEKNVGSKI